MPGITKTGGAWNEREKADLVSQIVSGALSVREACARYELSRDCVRDWVLVFRRSAVEAFDEHVRQTLATQGIDASEISAAGFGGSLGDITTADLIQTMDLGRRDGTITISHDGRESRIWCAAGAVVDAESGKLSGLQAVYRMLALKHGRVVAEFSSAPRTRTIHAGTTALLLDGARRMDECEVLLRRLGPERYVLGPKVLSSEATFSGVERAVLRSFYQASTVPAALADNEIGDLETLRAIGRLVEKGYLSCAEDPDVLPLAHRAPEAPSTAPCTMLRRRFGAVRL